MKIEFQSIGCVPNEVIERNVAYAHGLGLPYPKPTGHKHLAIVAGGGSVKGKIEQLKHWRGDVWIIASAFPWAYKNGLRGTYFNIDPSEDCLNEVAHVERAILASTVTPAVFDALKGKDVGLFDLVHTTERFNHGATTATAVPELSIILGYEEITFFGCESSYAEGSSHAYRDDKESNPICMDVGVGGEIYETRPDYFLQARFLSQMIKKFPQFREESGGLLRAMVKHGDWDILSVSRALYASLKFEEPTQDRE